MSVTIDFSDLFKSKMDVNSKRNIESIDDDYPKYTREVVSENTNTLDSAEWVKKCVRDMNYSIDDDELSPNVIKCLQGILYERFHMQQQNHSIISDCGKLRSQLEMASREKENMISQIAVLKQDLNFSNGKMAALKSEQRELRCQWLSEKSDLEGRCFQSLALVTQIQGTLRKKENDYNKLQQQLGKMVRDSQKQQKGSIVLSKPIPKSSSQVKTVTLRDAELQTAQESVRGLEMENRNLRQAVNDLSASYRQFQARVTGVMAAEAQVETQAQALLNTKRLSFITAGETGTAEAMDEVGEGEDIENIPPSPSPSMSLPTNSDPTDQPVLAASPIVAKKDPIEAVTPIDDQERARPTGSNSGPDPGSRDALLERAEDVSRSVRRLSQQVQCEGGERDWDVLQVRKQLDEALAVIREQDWLIHVALVGKLPSLSLGNDVDCSGLCWADEDQDAALEFSPRRASVSRRSSFGLYSARKAGGSSSRRTSTDSTGMGMGDLFSPSGSSFLDVLPPASPETMAVLAAAGWPLPRPLVLLADETTVGPADVDPAPPKALFGGSDLALALGLE